MQHYELLLTLVEEVEVHGEMIEAVVITSENTSLAEDESCVRKEIGLIWPGDPWPFFYPVEATSRQTGRVVGAALACSNGFDSTDSETFETQSAVCRNKSQGRVVEVVPKFWWVELEYLVDHACLAYEGTELIAPDLEARG